MDIIQTIMDVLQYVAMTDTVRPPKGVREADGVASRVDRLHAIGNGQVPAVVALAWQILACKETQENTEGK